MLSTNRIYIRKLELSDAEALYELRTRNLKYFQPFEPIPRRLLHVGRAKRKNRKKPSEVGKQLGIQFRYFPGIHGSIDRPSQSEPYCSRSFSKCHHRLFDGSFDAKKRIYNRSRHFGFGLRFQPSRFTSR